MYLIKLIVENTVVPVQIQIQKKNVFCYFYSVAGVVCANISTCKYTFSDNYNKPQAALSLSQFMCVVPTHI